MGPGTKIQATGKLFCRKISLPKCSAKIAGISSSKWGGGGVESSSTRLGVFIQTGCPTLPTPVPAGSTQGNTWHRDSLLLVMGETMARSGATGAFQRMGSGPLSALPSPKPPLPPPPGLVIGHALASFREVRDADVGGELNRNMVWTEKAIKTVQWQMRLEHSRGT